MINAARKLMVVLALLATGVACSQQPEAKHGQIYAKTYSPPDSGLSMVPVTSCGGSPMQCTTTIVLVPYYDPELFTLDIIDCDHVDKKGNQKCLYGAPSVSHAEYDSYLVNDYYPRAR